MGKVIIPKNYTNFTNANDILYLCKPLFNNSDIDYFGYGRIYKDGGHFFLDTYTRLQEYLLFERKGDNVFDFNFLNTIANHPQFVKNKNNKIYWFESDIDNGQFWNKTSKEFNIASLLYIMEKTTNYYELFGFASSTGKNICSFYINHHDVIEKFMLYFKEKAAVLIKSAEKNRIIIPRRSLEYYKVTRDLENIITKEKEKAFTDLSNEFKLKQYPITNNNIKTYITPRELECLNFLSKGRTCKEIGNILCISNRTVETTLQHIRSRLGVNSKDELLKVYYSSVLVNLVGDSLK